jgi:hypothetical protein
MEGVNVDLHFKLLVRGEGKGRQLGEEYKGYVK